jgi:adenylylsulfate kinase-like enzyme
VVGTGNALTRLVVLRGNSGSGKSTVAQLVRARLRPGPTDPARGSYRNNVALIEQDYIRRTLLGEYDRVDGTNIRLIDVAIRTALDAGFDVIVEAMLFAERYSTMLLNLTHEHRGRTRHWYFDASLAVTLQRHTAGVQKRPRSRQIKLLSGTAHRILLPEVYQRIVPGDWVADHAAAAIVADARSEWLSQGAR